MTFFTKIFLLLLLLVNICTFSASTTDNTILINTYLGQVRGNKVKVGNNYVYEFLGLKYGIPPINNLRFRPSQQNNVEYGRNAYDATSYGASCIQFPNTFISQSNMSEDCLYLNIWAPTMPNSYNLLPVMVYIHGGSFVSGSGSIPMYNGTLFVNYGSNFIYVSINYRLGPLGFLSSEQLYYENLNDTNGTFTSYGGLNGIYDQITALNWIKAYIKPFGGNPNDITIFGESAGGLSVCNLLITPVIAHNELFQNAIIESGSCIGPWSPLSLSDSLAFTDERLYNANYSSNINDLRLIDAFDLVYNLETTQYKSWNVGVDKYVLPDIPYNLYMNNQYKINCNNIIWGFNSLDGLASYPYFDGYHPDNDDDYYNILYEYISNDTIVNALTNYYYPPSDFVNVSYAWYSINADLCLICPTLLNAVFVSNNPNNHYNQYVYEFFGPAYPYYAPHASELMFVFDYPDPASYYSVPFDSTLSNNMMSAWSNFCKYNVPNITNPINNMHITWPLFINSNNNYNDDFNVLLLNNNITVRTDFIQTYRNNVCGYWFSEVPENTRNQICWNIKTLDSTIKKY